MNRQTGGRWRAKRRKAAAEAEPVRVLPAAPVTPEMLIAALLNLRDTRLVGLTYTADEVANTVRNCFANVQQDWELLLMEVSDKLKCSAEADLIGLKRGVGYYPLNLKQQGQKLESKSELMFWILYKNLLDQRKLRDKSRTKSWMTKKAGPTETKRRRSNVLHFDF